MRILRAAIMVSVVSAMCAAACKRTKPGVPAKSYDAAIVANKEPKPDPAVKKAARAKQELAARAIVERWRVAQNDSNFEAYQSLYAESFRGIRRSGVKRKEMDRAEWLTDRKRMFSKKTVVTLSDIVVQLEGDVAEVRFIQRWASEAYEDLGPKRLRLDLTAGQIVVEEMISSTVVANLRTASEALGLSEEDADRMVCEDLPDDPTRVVCVVDKSDDNLRAEYTVALFAKGKGTRRLLDKKTEAVEATEANYGPTNDRDVSSSLEQISEASYAVAVIARSESEGGWDMEVEDSPGGHNRDIVIKWFAVEGDVLREVYSDLAGGTSQLVYSGDFDEVTVRTLTSQHAGYFDLEVQTVTTEWGDDVGHVESEPQVTKETSVVRWQPTTRTYE